MMKRLLWLGAALLLLPVAAPVRGQGAGKPTAHKELTPPPAATPEPNDRYVPNEHVHQSNGLYFPPESHHDQDLDAAPNDQLNRNVRILRTTSKVQLNRYVPIVLRMQNVNPYNVLTFFHRVVSSEEGTIFTFVSDKGNDGLILMGVPEYQIPYVEELARTLDRPELTDADSTKRVYRQLKHRRANIDPANPLLDDAAFPNSLLTYLTDNSTRIVVDPTRNALYIEDAPTGIANLDTAYATALDVPTPEVVLNLKVYEVALENNNRIGLDYIAWKNGPGAALLATGAFKEIGRVAVSAGSGATVDPLNGMNALTLPRSNFSNQGANVAYRYEVPSAFFDFLTVRGKARLLSSAKVAALNTRPAQVTAGDQILYYAVQASNPSGVRARGDLFNLNNANRDTSASTPGGRTVLATTQRLDSDGALVPVTTGLTLNLTPLIYEKGVDVQVDCHLTDFNGFDDTGLPRINSRALTTTLRMNEGQETILGGLVREEQTKGRNQIPILGKLPVLGYLFGGESTRQLRKEVIVSLTAERIERFATKGYAITQADQKILDQADGRAPIQEPPLIKGFDQLGLDKERK